MQRISAFLLFAALAFAAPAAAQDRPNILFLFADDQRPDTIAAWGNRHIQTPHLDRLANSGFSFRRAYCLGSNSGAVCLPSRGMLNSGKAYFRIQPDLAGEKLLGEVLKANGYRTFGTGKWHNQQPSWLRSFDEGDSIFFGGMSDHTNVPLHALKDGKLEPVNNHRRFSSDLFADSAIEFIKNHEGPEPFYAYVAFTAPHDPRTPPRRYREMYYKKRPPLPPNFMPQHPFDNGALIIRDEELSVWPRTKSDVSEHLAEYYGLITHLDQTIGRILKALEESGKAENTLIVYAADHGLSVGSHGLLGKQSLYEHSMGTPLIFAGPGVPQRQESQALVYLLDIYPTLLAAAGAAPPAPIDGEDLQPVWRGGKQQVRDSLFLSYQDSQRAVTDGRWKLIRYPQIGHTQLFDLEKDPHEMKSLAEDASQASRIEALTNLMMDWQRKLGDTQSLTVENPKPKRVDLTGHHRNADRWQPMWILEKYFPELY